MIEKQNHVENMEKGKVDFHKEMILFSDPPLYWKHMAIF